MSLQSHFVTGPSGPIFWLVLFALWRVDRPLHRLARICTTLLRLVDGSQYSAQWFIRRARFSSRSPGYESASRCATAFDP